MAYINLLSSSETSLRCNVSGLQTDYNGAARSIYWYLDGQYKSRVSLANLVSSGGAYTFSGLSPGARYYVSCTITIDTGAWETNLGDYFTTDSRVIPKPNKWSWSSSNGPEYNASASQTSRAYSAAAGRGYLSDFSYLVWNDLCAKVNEIRSFVGTPWNSEYASYYATQMTSSNRSVTAARMNSLRYNVNTSLSRVTTGGTIYGSHLLEIANAINDGIDYL